MTSNNLRTLTHEALINHVRTRITGTPTPASPSAKSSYVSLDGVPAVTIAVYPKRRHRDTAAALSRIARMDQQTGRRSGELSYADFFRSDLRTQLVAS